MRAFTDYDRGRTYGSTERPDRAIRDSLDVMKGIDRHNPTPDRDGAERLRAALIAAALDGYEQAAMSGLCPDGAWEAAISAMRRLDLAPVLARVDQGADAGETR